jgi:hypothetical protein
VWLALLISILLLRQVGPAVTVSLDRGWYSPGDQLVITVSATGMAANETLWLYVDKPDGHNLYFAELRANDGTVVLTLPPDAPDGTYTITVTWGHQYIETGFIVETQPIPEFPSTPLVFFVAIAVAFGALFRWKASASAQAPTLDSRAYVVCGGVRRRRSTPPQQAAESA